MTMVLNLVKLVRNFQILCVTGSVKNINITVY